MHTESVLEQLTIGAVAVIVAAVYAVRGTRGQRAVLVPSAILIGTLVGLGLISPVVAYGLLCLAMAGVYLIREERAQRRRVASLARRQAVDVVPTLWIAISAASVFMLTPYVIFAYQRPAALLVGLCAIVMVVIAWRIATAPMQLVGTDIQLERTQDRTTRSRRTGITAVLAVGSIMVFTAFVNAELSVVTPGLRIVRLAALLVWGCLWAWEARYVRRLERLSGPVRCD
ncbi:MAG: hypothetical protein ABR584_01720 [Candidatus Baltobacteraceae bacterium]